MNDEPATKRWSQRLSRASGILVLLTVAALIVAGPGYRMQIIELSLAFKLTLAAAGLAILALLLGLAAMALGRHHPPRRWGAMAGVLVGALIVAQLGSWYVKAKSVPAIHDITTNTLEPPVFDAIAPLRATAPNPISYAGAEVAREQLSAYPDIKTLTFSADVAAVTLAAGVAAERLGWEVIALDATSGHLEATDTTFWYGYKDDIVVRVRPDNTGSLVDVRSKSRVGKSDLGTNANRIREFTQLLSTTIGS